MVKGKVSDVMSLHPLSLFYSTHFGWLGGFMGSGIDYEKVEWRLLQKALDLLPAKDK